MNPSTQFNLETKAAYRQISDHFRVLIREGELAPGVKLPNLHDLAKQFNTSYFTVQSALTPLVREGLIERKKRSGTFVSRNKNQIGCVGLYFGIDFWIQPESAFYQALNKALKEHLEKGNTAIRLWLDTRNKEEQSVPLPELLKAIRNNEIQCLIAPSINGAEVAWLKALPIPYTFLISGNDPKSVLLDNRKMLRDAIASLKKQGCRSIGLISPLHMPCDMNTDRENRRFYDNFRLFTRKAGLETKEEWIRIPGKRIVTDELFGMRNYGYEQMDYILSLDAGPDGMIVWPDVVAGGAVMSVMKSGIDVPRQLKLALHRHDEVDYICPFDVTWIRLSVKSIAEALVDQVKNQLAGKKAEPITVGYRIEESPQEGSEKRSSKVLKC